MCDQASFKTNTCSDVTNVVGDSPTYHKKYPVVVTTKNAVHCSLKQMEMLADILKTNTAGNVSKSLLRSAWMEMCPWPLKKTQSFVASITASNVYRST